MADAEHGQPQQDGGELDLGHETPSPRAEVHEVRDELQLAVPGGRFDLKLKGGLLPAIEFALICGVAYWFAATTVSLCRENQAPGWVVTVAAPAVLIGVIGAGLAWLKYRLNNRAK
ncbi:hypothetical protein [Catellatospora tritici]|uniref:hypothetical protein n=1 Tax=Catellatospora tritici TaxID=2851566 RepID=UPI001C2DBD6A|nr:hypothetical protein [Catellatospora tritici]MBV1851872.1 hypothetical protein [Catellatospora tritici]